MEDDLDAIVIKNTQISLGKYVKRPPLSDKLLRKPPFRFLHDIVTSVLKSKGFFEGLFEDNELASENVKDRESKISFLNKVITVVSLTTGKPLTVKPSKIVAGQEPAKTNELLQCLAEALDNNLSSNEAVKQFKSGIKVVPSNDKKNKEPVKPLKKNIESKKLTSRSSEKLVTREKDAQSLTKSKTKDVSLHKKESPPKKSLPKTSIKKPPGKSNPQVRNNAGDQKSIPDNLNLADNISKDNQQDEVLNEDTTILAKESSSNEKKPQPDINLQKGLSNVATNHQKEQLVVDVNESILNSTSAFNSMQENKELDRFEIGKEENINDNHSLTTDKNEIDHINEETNTQSTHNSEDTKLSEIVQIERDVPVAKNLNKNDLGSSSIIRPPSVRPSSSRPGAPRIKDKSDNVINEAENIIVGKVNIISENTLHEEEEDTSIIIENNINEDLHPTFQNQEHNNLVNQNSNLVQQILDSQREFTQISGKTEIEWQFGAQKAPDVFIQEMEHLKFSVQALSRIANPLGKLLDHIQEDVEIMRQELQQWTQLYEETSKELVLQKNTTNEVLLPFHTKLKQLTADMEERHDKITDLKISIHKNDSRIEKLLTSSNVQ